MVFFLLDVCPDFVPSPCQSLATHCLQIMIGFHVKVASCECPEVATDPLARLNSCHFFVKRLPTSFGWEQGWCSGQLHFMRVHFSIVESFTITQISYLLAIVILSHYCTQTLPRQYQESSKNPKLATVSSWASKFPEFSFERQRQEEYDEAMKEYRSSEGYKKNLGNELLELFCADFAGLSEGSKDRRQQLKENPSRREGPRQHPTEQMRWRLLDFKTSKKAIRCNI